MPILAGIAVLITIIMGGISIYEKVEQIFEKRKNKDDARGDTMGVSSKTEETK